MIARPIHIVIVVAIIAIVWFVFIFDGGFNLGQIIGEPIPEGTDNCNYDNRDIHAALSVLSGKALPYDQTEPYIDSLNMRLCSADDTNYATVGDYYQTLWEADGYTVITTSYDYRSSYSTFTGGWYKGLNGKAIIAGSGSGITAYYGHDTMFITASGPLTTYYSFVAFVNSV